MKLEELKQQIAGVEVRNGRSVFSTEIRQAALEYTRQAVDAGKSLNVVSRELGLVGCTLGRWRQIERGDVSVKRRPSFVEVSVSPAKEKSEERNFVIKCPSGHEVSIPGDFEVDKVKRLLQAVGGA